MIRLSIILTLKYTEIQESTNKKKEMKSYDSEGSSST